MEVMFSVAVPVFFSVTVCGALVLPTATAPKFRLVGETVATGPELAVTVTVTDDWNSVPEVFVQPLTRMMCVPVGTGMLVSMELTPGNFAAGVEFESRYTQIDDTPWLECAAATTCTGEVTVEPLAGEQMVIDGSVVPGVHCAAARAGSTASAASSIAAVKRR